MKGHFKGFPKLVIYHSYKGKTLKSGNFCKFHIISFLRACFSSLITARNGGHCSNLGNEPAQGFSDAVVGDSYAIEKKYRYRMVVKIIH